MDAGKRLLWSMLILLCALAPVVYMPGLASAQAVSKGIPPDHSCSDNVLVHLDEIGVDMASIKIITIQQHSWPVAAWITPADSEGSLIMRLSQNCRVEQVYTLGGYELPGN